MPKRLVSSDAARGLGLAAAVGLFLALIAPYGTDAAPLALRFAYWVPLMVVGAALAELVIWAVTRAWPVEGRPAGRFLLLTAAITAPVTLLVWAVTGPVFLGRPYPLAALSDLAWRVAVITAGMTALTMALEARRPAAVEAAPAAEPPRFLDRLPPRLRGAELLAVQAEDHYLRLHTDRGSDLILMRLSDAVDELQGADGAQVHRSWWVGRAAIRNVRRGDGRAVLTLSNGLEVPVSRRHARALRAAGWY